VATVLLVRHGRSSANRSGVLAGQTEGVLLDEVGEQQAASAAVRLAGLPLAAVVSSPLERCLQTAEAVTSARSDGLSVQTDDRLIECGYGEWTGQELKKLSRQPMWKIVQNYPSAARFPGGESMAEMQQRALAAVREWDDKITAEHGPRALWVAVSHGDVIKAIVADAAGSHLDHFQRLVVDPGSVSAVTYTPLRPFVLRLNDSGTLDDLKAAKRRRRRMQPPSGDAVVGGTTGS
jgi:probable phosphomutase (TIGR03848 family)